jgi:hypothetical protein
LLENAVLADIPLGEIRDASPQQAISATEKHSLSSFLSWISAEMPEKIGSKIGSGTVLAVLAGTAMECPAA